MQEGTDIIVNSLTRVTYSTAFDAWQATWVMVPDQDTDTFHATLVVPKGESGVEVKVWVDCVPVVLYSRSSGIGGSLNMLFSIEVRMVAIRDAWCLHVLPLLLSECPASEQLYLTFTLLSCL